MFYLELTDDAITVINRCDIEDACIYGRFERGSDLYYKSELVYYIDVYYLDHARYPSFDDFYNTQIEDLKDKIPRDTVEWFYKRRIDYLNGKIEEDYDLKSGEFSKLYDNNDDWKIDWKIGKAKAAV